MIGSPSREDPEREIGFCAYLVKLLEFKALFDAIANCHQEIEQQRERERVLAATTDA